MRDVNTIWPPEFTCHETPRDTECRSSVGHLNTKILPSFPPSLASDRLPYKVYDSTFDF